MVEPREAVALLWEAKKKLKDAWGWDLQDPKRYPINTSYELAQLRASLTLQVRTRRVKIVGHLMKPRKLADLVPEKLIKTTWEEQNRGTYLDALKRAAVIDFKKHKESWKVFQGIVRATETAFLVNFLGHEVLPKPKVSILHRGLNQIARDVGLQGLTGSGFAELLDDLCPCEIRNHEGAVRKLWRRSPLIRLSKPSITKQLKR
jgi:hypothetical protein